MDTISDVWAIKFLMFSIIWMAVSPFYFTYKDYDVNVKTVTVMMFPLIVFLVWFFVFWWG